MTEPTKCDVCGGFGDYPIYDDRGSYRMTIRCPECFGIGTIEPEEQEEEPADWPPPSTATRVHTKEALAQAVKDWNER